MARVVAFEIVYGVELTSPLVADAPVLKEIEEPVPVGRVDELELDNVYGADVELTIPDERPVAVEKLEKLEFETENGAKVVRDDEGKPEALEI